MKRLFDQHTFAADEFGIQTIIMNSPYMDSVYHSEESGLTDNLRLLGFQRGNGLGSPHIYMIEGFDEIRSSNNFFCRKFDMAVDRDVVDKVITELLKK